MLNKMPDDFCRNPGLAGLLCLSSSNTIIPAFAESTGKDVQFIDVHNHLHDIYGQTMSEDFYGAVDLAVQEVLTAKDPNPNYHHFAPNNVMFSADGSRVFQAAQNGIRVWKLSQP